MAIIYTYPRKSSALLDNDLFVISDSSDDNETKSITLKQISDAIGGGGGGGQGLVSISANAPISVTPVSNNTQTVSWTNPYSLLYTGSNNPYLTLSQDGAAVGTTLQVSGAGGISVDVDSNNSNNIIISSSNSGGSVTSVGLDLGSTGLLTSGATSQSITGSGTFTITGTLSTANGGTGLSSIGTANQVLQVNSAGTALEYSNEAYAAERIIEKMYLNSGSVEPGTAVVVVGSFTDGNGKVWPAVQCANADPSGKMPCIGLSLNSATVGGYIEVILQGEVELDTTNISGTVIVGYTVYVASQPGTAYHNLTTERPKSSGGSVPLIQNVGIISKVGATGVIQVSSVNRPNAAPNLLDKGSIFASDADGYPQDLGVGSDTQVLMADSSETLGVKWSGITASNLTAPGINTEVIHNSNGNFAAHYGFTQDITLGNPSTDASITHLKIGQSGTVGTLDNCNQGHISLYGMNPSGAVGFAGADEGKATFWCTNNNHSVTIKGPGHSGSTPDNYSINLPLVKPSGANNTLMWDGGTVSNNNYNLEWADSSGSNIWTRVVNSQTDIYFTGPSSPGRVGININSPVEDGLTIVGNLKVDAPNGSEGGSAAGQAWVTPMTMNASGSTTQLDFNNGNVQELQLTNNVTLSLASLKQGATYIVVIKQSTSASYTVTWPSEVKWVGTAPVMTTVQGAVDVYSFICTEAFGSTSLILGTASQNYTV